MAKNGITYQNDNMLICLDPKNSVAYTAGSSTIATASTHTNHKTNTTLNFVSHAHTDHLPHNGAGTILSSNETRALAGLRELDMPHHITEYEGVSLHDTGHVLGSRGLLCGANTDDPVYYTGDICIRDRGFLTAAKIPKCKTLIMECTFGLPEFLFPTIDKVQRQVNQIITDMYSRGVPVILMGYQLGKSQTITHLFQHWDPFYLHDSVKIINDVHRKFGVNLKDCMGHTQAEQLGLLDKKPWVMVAPLLPEKNEFVKHMKSRYGAVTVGFTGWACSKKFLHGRVCDYSVPLSDHCDFLDLLRVAVASEAEKVYTVHGFVDEFASHLQRDYGINAEPLR